MNYFNTFLMIIKIYPKEKQPLSWITSRAFFMICKCLVIFSKLIRDKILVNFSNSFLFYFVSSIGSCFYVNPK